MAVRPRTATTSTILDYTTLPTLFCIVRPPPSNSTHPLNLQIQLLVPSIPTTQRTESNRRSGEYSRSSSRSGSIADDGAGGGGDNRLKVGTPNSAAGGSAISFDAIAGASVSRSGSRASNEVGTGGEELSRIPSGGSTRSRGSTNSMSVRSDTASSNGTGTGTATRRRVTPLLNLSFHSVLPTVVTDAGTDQRVAKFLKRGIEISNLAIIDPIDLSQPPSLVPSNVSLSPQTSPPRSSTMVNGSSSSAPSTNGLFTKFKKFTLGNSATKQPSSPNPASPTSSSFSLFARSTSTSSNLSNASSSPSKFLPSLVGGNSEGAPTPRTVPLLRSGSDELASATSHGPLPSGYAFVVRKWLRDDLIQVSDAGGIPAQNTAIRIEWVRASDREYKKGRGRTRANRSQSVVSIGGENGGLSSSSRRGSEADPGLTVPPSVPEDEEVGTSSNGHENGQDEEDDDGESSDPEDSERPFICTLFYPSSSSASSSAPTVPSKSPTSTSMQPSPSLRRLQLATLRPAPHHPKLIATLLLPPTLPSIPLGSFSPSQGLKGGVLSNETLRDLVHVSSMFVAIREGLGGLSREKDSQNIAAGLGLVKVKSRKVGRSFRGFGKG